MLLTRRAICARCICTSRSAIFNHHSGPKRLSFLFERTNDGGRLSGFFCPRSEIRLVSDLACFHIYTTTQRRRRRGVAIVWTLWTFASPPCVGAQTIPKCIVLNENESLPALCLCVCVSVCAGAGACTVLRVLCHQGGLLQLTLTCAVNRSALRRRRLFFSLVNGPYRQHLMKINDQL